MIEPNQLIHNLDGQLLGRAISPPRFSAPRYTAVIQIRSKTGGVSDYPVILLEDSIQNTVFEDLRVVSATRTSRLGTVMGGTQKVCGRQWLPVVWDGEHTLQMVCPHVVRPVNSGRVVGTVFGHAADCFTNCTCPTVVFETAGQDDRNHAYGCPSIGRPCKPECVQAASRLPDYQSWDWSLDL